MSESSSSSSGPGLFVLLGVLFIGLKLTGYIDWSWWWVTAPLWGGFALVFTVMFVAAIAQEVARSKRPRRRGK